MAVIKKCVSIYSYLLSQCSNDWFGLKQRSLTSCRKKWKKIWNLRSFFVTLQQQNAMFITNSEEDILVKILKKTSQCV